MRKGTCLTRASAPRGCFPWVTSSTLTLLARAVDESRLLALQGLICRQISPFFFFCYKQKPTKAMLLGRSHYWLSADGEWPEASCLRVNAPKREKVLSLRQ